ncbi:MAG: glycosyltransferase [Prevotella sp.]|jgi:glycosyltransferase involved in cell wall biosynthesis|nr:glycosyltransferase [Prevotella sp.]
MKIAHISTFVSSGGAAIAAFRLHQSLMKHPDIESSMIQKYAEDRGFMQQNNIYLAEKDKSLIAKIERKLKIDKVTLQNKKLEELKGEYEITSIPFSSYRLEDHPKIKEADIIHLHWVADNFLNYPTFFKKTKQPIVWTLHDMNPFQGIFHYKDDEIQNRHILGNIDKKYLKLKQDSINKKSNITIATPSAWLGNLSKNSDTFSGYNHVVIPYGMDFSLFSRLDRIEAKKKIGVNNSSKTILFVSAGLDNPRKGIDLLLKAIDTLNEQNYNLISVGHGNIDICKKINYIHLGSISDSKKLNEVYSAADMTILPSREDNLPNVMLESFANGTPVISFGNGGMAEHIKNGENGILINEINPDALATGINEFLEDKYYFNNDNIRKYAIDNFSDDRQTEKYIELYNSLLK